MVQLKCISKPPAQFVQKDYILQETKIPFDKFSQKLSDLLYVIWIPCRFSEKHVFFNFKESSSTDNNSFISEQLVTVQKQQDGIVPTVSILMEFIDTPGRSTGKTLSRIAKVCTYGGLRCGRNGFLMTIQLTTNQLHFNLRQRTVLNLLLEHSWRYWEINFRMAGLVATMANLLEPWG